MNKTDIEWCDMTWNPVTGCLRGCEYCYARRQAKRFMGYHTGGCMNLVLHRDETGELHDLHNRMWISRGKYLKVQLDKASYPFGFDPTFHRYRLEEPQKLKKPQNIFVCSMADIFGDWVPDEWIQQVFKACEAAPWHRYLFLTKNPRRIPLSSFVYSGKFATHAENFWFGMTVTDQKSLEKDYKHFTNIIGNTFISIEPLIGPVDLSRIDTGNVIYSVPKSMGYYLGGGQKVKLPGWVIIGAQTGPGSSKHQPRREWIETIVNDCRATNVPVFMKNSLAQIWGEPLIQEYPWEA